MPVESIATMVFIQDLFPKPFIQLTSPRHQGLSNWVRLGTSSSHMHHDLSRDPLTCGLMPLLQDSHSESLDKAWDSGCLARRRWYWCIWYMGHSWRTSALEFISTLSPVDPWLTSSSVSPLRSGHSPISWLWSTGALPGFLFSITPSYWCPFSPWWGHTVLFMAHELLCISDPAYFSLLATDSLSLLVKLLLLCQGPSRW